MRIFQEIQFNQRYACSAFYVISANSFSGQFSRESNPNNSYFNTIEILLVYFKFSCKLGHSVFPALLSIR